MSGRAVVVLVARAAWGAALVAAPRRVLRAVGATGDDGEVAAARVAGSRHLVECLAQGTLGGWVRPWERRVDVVHAVTMAGTAVVDVRHRRAALVSGAMAVALAAATPVGP